MSARYPLKILLTHSPSDLANYYGPRALAALQAVGDVRLRNFEDPWPLAAGRAGRGSPRVPAHR